MADQTVISEIQFNLTDIILDQNSTHFNGTDLSALINGTQSTTPAITLTPYELWTQLIFFYGFLCGVVSTVCSILIWVGIWRKKSLRTRFFIIVGFLTFCRTGICVQFLIMAIYRSLRTLGIASTYQYRLSCHFIHFWLINGWTIEMFLLCTLVIDRVVAVVASNYYRLLSTRSAFYVCLMEYVILSILKLAPSYVDPVFEIVKCLNLYSFLNDKFNEYSQYIDLIMVGVIMILYFVLIIYVRIRVKRMKESQQDKANEASNAALRRQLKLMPILRNLVLMHCGLSLTSKILLALSSIVPLADQQRMTAYGGAMGCVDVFTNVTMLLFTNADVRQASIPCWKKKNSTLADAMSKAATQMLDIVPKSIRSLQVVPVGG